ncbi:hypothetical protein like AT1G74940 [Hibiscus trionum]|uniref:FLZ-type domain-containing protein n=1 Tax=Hibiscus trionum TaxID=183268 RepID=A0A9W7I5S8_HIBTR|nr:hypothetical protein like AT1G74940 [Hibiscus trionum]
MLGRRARPLIGNLPELLASSQKSGLWDPLRSPRSPLDLKTPSPRGLKRYDVGGVGLGIIASMEKSIRSPSSTRPTAIVVNNGNNHGVFKVGFEGLELEDFTFVTSHHGPGKSSTKVYFNNDTLGHDRNGFLGAVKETPSPPPPPPLRSVEDVEYPTSDFLSSCHLCRKSLHGKDIYMYRGEKAFCSSECRSTQIMNDERKEKCKPEALKSAENSSLGYDNNNNNNNNSGQIFWTGILAI